MKKFIAFIAVALALVISVSVIAIAESAETVNAEAAETVEVAETEAVATEEPTVEPTAEPTPEPTPEPHYHTWSADGRVCTGCGEAHPCWNDEEKTFVHDFTDSEICLVCETALYCGVEGHEKNEQHALGACGVPGHFVCDGLAHDEIYGNGFDPEGHTACLEQVEHTCEDCGRTYTCEFSNSHVRCIKCGNMWCYKAEGDHTEASCGHRYCEIHGNYKEHAKCEGCGKYLCNGKDHSGCVAPDPTPAPEATPSPAFSVPPTEE